MQKKLTVLFAFAIFVLVLGWSITPAPAHCKKSEPPHHDGKCGGVGGDPTIGLCQAALCIADVGKSGSDTPARQFASQFDGGGHYTIGTALNNLTS